MNGNCLSFMYNILDPSSFSILQQEWEEKEWESKAHKWNFKRMNKRARKCKTLVQIINLVIKNSTRYDRRERSKTMTCLRKLSQWQIFS
jgi:hypothetical protein